jgi:hypothetical protein
MSGRGRGKRVAAKQVDEQNENEVGEKTIYV